MISNSNALQQPGRRIVLLSKIKKMSPMRPGSLTQAFFLKGDQLEASGYENLAHDDPTLVPPRMGFRSFDRVPHNRAPLLITLLLIATAALSVVWWYSVRGVPNGMARVATTVRTRASSELVRLKSSFGSKYRL